MKIEKIEVEDIVKYYPKDGRVRIGIVVDRQKNVLKCRVIGIRDDGYRSEKIRQVNKKAYANVNVLNASLCLLYNVKMFLVENSNFVYGVKKEEGFISYTPLDLLEEKNEVFEVLRDLINNKKFINYKTIEESLKVRILQDNQHYFDYLESHMESKNEN